MPHGTVAIVELSTDANKMHQNVAFSEIKLQNFLGSGLCPLPTPHRSVFEEFNRRLSFVYRGPIHITTLIITVGYPLSFGYLVTYNC